MVCMRLVKASLIFAVSRNNGVPPSPPSELRVTSVTRSSVTLAWPPSRVDGGSPVTVYRLHYHRQFGDWDRVDILANLTSYALLNLRCGTIYQFYMEAINDFGVGERTDTVTVPTQGTPPRAPTLSHGLLSVNATSIDIHLASWDSGGCDVSSFVIEYRGEAKDSSSGDDWILVNNNVRPSSDLSSDKKYVVLDLKPGTLYVLRITAHNSAGSTVKEYSFSTLGNDGKKMAASEERPLVNQTPMWNLSIILLVPVGLVMAGMGFALCLQRRRLKEGLSGMVVRFTRAANERPAEQPSSEPDLTDGLRLPCNSNAYELSEETEDVNYGFGRSTLHQGHHRPPMDAASTTLSHETTMIIAGASPALLSRKLNDAVIMMTHDLIII